MPKTICVSSNKGGCGKTTTAVHLAHGLAISNHQVLLVDLDKQGHCATFVGCDAEPRVYDLLVKELPLDELTVEARPKLHILTGNSRTVMAQEFAKLQHAHVNLLQQTIIEHAAGYDYIVFDTHPQGLLQECAVYSADILIVPVPVDYLGMDGALQFVKMAEELQQREKLNHIPLFFVPTFVDRRTAESTYNLEILQEKFGEQVLEPVPTRTRMREAVAEGQTIFEYAPKDDSATVYTALCKTIVKVLNG